MAAAESLTIVAPDDWHHHLRDGPVLPFTTSCAAKQFKRAICMPNLNPPVTSVDLALAYRERILAAMPAESSFEPLMTIYLTDSTTPDEIRKAKDSGVVFGVKLSPAGATTNSASGVTDLGKVTATLETMQELDMPLLVHGEVTTAGVDIFDRESTFIEQTFKPLVLQFPKLKFVMEHITTKEGVDFVTSAPANVGGTITPQHLLYNRNNLLVGGIKPHLYCLPILKAEQHRLALLQAATSGNPKFFLGTDSAPHTVENKHSACGSAGVFSAHAALELYAMAFDSVGALDKLEAFSSFNGPDFYGLPRNSSTVTILRESRTVSGTLPFGRTTLVPLKAGETLPFTLQPSSPSAAAAGADDTEGERPAKQQKT